MKRLFLLCLVVFVTGIGPVQAQNPYDERCAGRVTMDMTTWLNVRDAPAGQIVGRLYRGAGVYISEAAALWYRVDYGGLSSAWVSATYVEIETPERCEGIGVGGVG